MNNIVRIEVTFNNGKFVAFPKVYRDTIIESVNSIVFTHGERKDIAYINRNNLNFYEMINDNYENED